MELSTILTPGRTLCGMPGSSKKRTLQEIAAFIAADIPGFDTNELFDQLMARERLGSTGLGKGIAIPHCRMKNCHRIVGSLFRLSEPVDFDAVDGEKVDLLFVLLVPEQAHAEHLTVLAKLAEQFSNPDYCRALRAASSNSELFAQAVA